MGTWWVLVHGVMCMLVWVVVKHQRQGMTGNLMDQSSPLLIIFDNQQMLHPCIRIAALFSRLRDLMVCKAL